MHERTTLKSRRGPDHGHDPKTGRVTVRQWAVFVIFILVVASFVRNARELQKSLNYYKTVKQQNALEVARKKQLHIQSLKERSVLEIENRLRNELNYTKEGEIIIVVPSPTPRPSPTPAVAPEPYKEWLRIFFGV